MSRTTQSARSALIVLVAAILGCSTLRRRHPQPRPRRQGRGTADRARLRETARRERDGAHGRHRSDSRSRQRSTDRRVRQTRVELSPALAAVKGITLLPFDSTGASKARYVVTGVAAPGEGADHYTLTVALSDRQSRARRRAVRRAIRPGRARSQADALLRRGSGPRARPVERRIHTNDRHAHGNAADALYISQVETSALLADALAAYNAEKWANALALYTAAAKRTDGQQLRTFNGLYLTNVRLGNTAAAEQAFGKIVQLGLETNNLAVKLLFRPGSATEFWPGRDYSGVYPIWIRQLARAMQASGHCVNVVGHTSHTGTEALNDRLSLQRAETVKRLLEGEVRALSSKLKASGVGYRENIIGSGQTTNATRSIGGLCSRSSSAEFLGARTS